MKTYYDILEVSRYASDEVIKRAYKVLIKEYHPDLKSGSEKKEAEKKIKEINEAYEILADKTKKEKYDRELEIKEQMKNQAQAQTQAQNRNSGFSRNYANEKQQKNNMTQNQNSETKKENETFSGMKDSEYEMHKSNIEYQNYINQKINEAQDRINKQEYEVRKGLQDAYINRLKSMGYEVKVEKPFSWKEFWAKVLTFLIFTTIIVSIYLIPFSNQYLKELEEMYTGVKIVSGIFRAYADFILKLFFGINR